MRLPQWLAAEGLTAGLATPVVAAQVAAPVATWMHRIEPFVRALINSLRRLGPLLRRLGEVFAELRGLLGGPGRSDGPRHGGEAHPVHPPPPLTDADRAALHYYTTSEGYTRMNPFLRDPDTYSDAEAAAIRAEADRVSAGPAKLPEHPGTTYRGVDLNEALLARYEKGEIVTERALTSTPTDPAVPLGQFEGNTVMVVTGRNGRDIAPFSEYPEVDHPTEGDVS